MYIPAAGPRRGEDGGQRRTNGTNVIILASAVDGVGGVEMVNRLVLAAASQAGLRGSVVALRDRPGAAWTEAWPHSRCAAGSWTRFVVGAWSRRSDAANSVVFVTHVGLAPVGRLLKRSGPTTLVVFVHGVEAWRTLPMRTTWGLRGCDLIVTNSRHTLERFLEHSPTLRTLPARVCYLPARPLVGAPAVRHEAGPGRPRVLIVGRMEGRGLLKGQRELIAIWPRVLAEFPTASLCIVGDGAGRAEFERLAHTHRVVDSLTFTGTVSDAELDVLYSTSDVFAMPSRGEGFGFVFAEAMAHGLPCIASRLDAGAEVVVDGETGLVVDPGQPVVLLGALRTLLADSALRARMGEAGRRRAVELFSLDRFNRTIQAVLAGLETPQI